MPVKEEKDKGKKGVHATQQHPPLFPSIFTEATSLPLQYPEP